MLIDLTKMIICIKNIVQNAFKYADTEKGVDISILLSKNMYIIEVQDYGPGIKKEDRPHIFESFYRASVSKKISGFGLGLAISKKIIEAHKGTLDLAKNKEGYGCNFVITIPILEEKENDK